MDPGYTIREAKRDDIDVLVRFTQDEALEAEGIELDVDTVRRGVQVGLDRPLLATYWVVETANDGVIASVSVVTEWSNFHGGYYWWIQSLFIVPEHRGRGLAEFLLKHLVRAAQAAGALDLRLYAHKSNERALRAYRRLGFETADYTIMTRRLKGD